ncbi:polysaccharide pyruvyl transferase family protein [Bengtsoniella intestinalis]|uniref:polysaccharide pyruvyl transferase family protein n=1 Tax=Bengtsoniella intestinalis TaxID=3073143 RepID=UPI00391F494F
MNIGILTMYPHNYNYGGVLQSYALPVFCKQHLSCRAYQMPSDYSARINLRRCPWWQHYSNKDRWKRWLSAHVYTVIRRNDKDLRIQQFKAFESQIPTATQGFDAVVVGSDQVWNPHWFCRTFFAPPVPLNVPVIAYAASFGVSALTQKEASIMLPLIERFQAISVREPSAKTNVIKISLGATRKTPRTF